MHLTRKQSLVAAVGVLGAFFATAIMLVNMDTRVATRNANDPEQARLIEWYKGTASSVSASPASSSPAPQPSAADSMPGDPAKFSLNEFYRSETRDGKKLWEVKAKTGQYFPETNSATLSSAEMHFYRKEGEVVDIFAEEAVLHLLGPTLSKAEGKNGVRLIYNGKLTVTTDRAIYDRQAGTIHAPGHVEISSATLDTSGEILDVDVEKSVMKISRDVQTIVKPRNKSPEA